MSKRRRNLRKTTLAAMTDEELSRTHVTYEMEVDSDGRFVRCLKRTITPEAKKLLFLEMGIDMDLQTLLPYEDTPLATST